jgi:hypothetical protein
LAWAPGHEIGNRRVRICLSSGKSAIIAMRAPLGVYAVGRRRKDIAKVPEKQSSDRAIEVRMSTRPPSASTSSQGWTRFTAIVVAIVIAVAIAGHIHGRSLGARDVQERDEVIQQLRARSQELTERLTDQNEKFDALQAKLMGVQAVLDALIPSENTYTLGPNQSIIVAGGRLTIGLVGSPANQGVVVNVNGKEQSAAAGGIISVTLDASTVCQIKVQAFDMFKATLTASCAAAKPQ